MEPVVFMTYEKMSDDLMYLSNNVVLRFNINLASYNKDGKRVKRLFTEGCFMANTINVNIRLDEEFRQRYCWQIWD